MEQICITCGLELEMSDQDEADDTVIKFHKTCIKCYSCLAPLGDNKWCFMHKGVPYCDVTCLQTRRRPKDSFCFECKGQLTGNTRVIKLRGRMYHIKCMRCAECGEKFKPGSPYKTKKNEIVCPKHMEVKKKEPLIRTKISKSQRLSLIHHYKNCKYPNSMIRTQIAEELKLTPSVVKVWYQNWRARNNNQYY